MSSVATIYTFSSCDTCRQATRWLHAHAVEFVEKPIRISPPSVAELKEMLGYQCGQIGDLFNRAGKDYREQDLKIKLPEMNVEEAFKLLSANGNLVKRPFFLGSDFGLVGFKEAVWEHAFKKTK